MPTQPTAWPRQPRVSVFSLSNGQRFCDRNALLNVLSAPPRTHRTAARAPPRPSVSRPHPWPAPQVLYQSYPADRLELLMFETSFRPSPSWIRWSTSGVAPDISSHLGGASTAGGEGVAPTGAPHIMYRWFNASVPKQMGRLPADQVRALKDWTRPTLRVQSSPKLGYMRNLALKSSRGDAIVHMDNDDFYHPRYVELAVGHLVAHRLPALLVTPHGQVTK